ncbi:MAG: alpha-ketoglutarate-dependent dioxygenase AlkB [Candidatus Velthaea sp.]
MAMRQLGLFATAAQPTVLVGDHGDVTYIPDFVSGATGAALFGELHESTDFKADSRMMYGRRVLVPRETAARGAKCPQEWSPTLLQVRALVEAHVGTSFDYVFINRYRNGNDSVAWHNDNDAEEDPRRIIASLSLGATRTFELRPKRASGLDYKKVAVDVAHGDLIVMQGDTQLYWEHRVPKEPRIAGERINLTFRQHQVQSDV